MLAAAAIGAVAAVVASLPALLERAGGHLVPASAWHSPLALLIIAVLAMLIQHFVVERRSLTRGYDGLADLFIHVHAPSSADSPLRWLIRGFLSLLLSLFGGVAGPEGAAVEMTHALSIQLRDPASRWSEQRRRTDAASALAAGFAAAFGAPFAAVLLPIELGIGGRTSSVALSSLVAFMVSRSIGFRYSLSRPDLSSALSRFSMPPATQWLVVLAIAVAAGVAGLVTTRLVRYFQDSLLDLFQTRAWMRMLAGGILLCLIALVYPAGHLPGSTLLESAFWGQMSTREIALLAFSQLFTLAALLAGFGTIGIFWPTLALGGLVGLGVNNVLGAGFPGAAALIGGAAFWAALLGNPISSAVAAFEITGNASVMVPCFLSALLALEIRKRLRTPTLFEWDLEARGMGLIEGKSRKILEVLKVRDAMVSDHDTVHEQETVAELHARLLNSRYPFLPVVDSRGAYRGLLTIDAVRDAWKRQEERARAQGEPEAVTLSLSKLLEAKDLLYRTKNRVRTVRASDRLILGIDGAPCLPVLTDDGRIAGLLFAYNIRLAYDREVARQSLGFDTAPDGAS